MATEKKNPDTIRDALDASIESLPPATLAKLRQARQRALAQEPAHPASRTRRWWLPASAISATAASAVLSVWLTTTMAPQARVNGLEDIDMLASADNTELYEQMEFYEWLDSQQPDNDTDAG